MQGEIRTVVEGRNSDISWGLVLLEIQTVVSGGEIQTAMEGDKSKWQRVEERGKIQTVVG